MLALATNALATQLTLNENGEITNIDDIIADTKTQSPSLFSDPNKVRTVPATGSQPNQKGKLTLEDIKNMPISERPKNWTQLVT